MKIKEAEALIEVELDICSGDCGNQECRTIMGFRPDMLSAFRALFEDFSDQEVLLVTVKKVASDGDH